MSGSLKDLFSAIQQVQGLFGQLNQDIDPSSPREETKKDVQELQKGLGIIQQLFPKLQQEDMDAISREVNELFSGKQGFMDYISDVSSIMNEVENRTSADKAAKEKVDQHLQGDNVGSFLQGFQQIIGDLNKLSSKVQDKR